MCVSLAARVTQAPELFDPNLSVTGITEEDTGVEASVAGGVGSRKLMADLATHRQRVAAVLRRLPQSDARFDGRVPHFTGVILLGVVIHCAGY